MANVKGAEEGAGEVEADARRAFWCASFALAVVSTAKNLSGKTMFLVLGSRRVASRPRSVLYQSFSIQFRRMRKRSH
eukprot:1849788-Pyramimonas_sp.AAC.1